jgi:parallel beta-helix repeat protein
MLNTLFGSLYGLVIAAVAMAASSALAAPPAGPITHKCTSPVSAAKLQEKIDAAQEGDVIEVTGDCVGFNYLIAINDLTFRGVDGATLTGDGLAPAISIIADRVSVENWAGIDGGASNGIVVRASGSATVSDIGMIEGNIGIIALQSAFAEVEGSTIQASQDGVLVQFSGSVKLTDNTISFNGRDGVLVVTSGTAEIAAGNNISNNGRYGVIASSAQVGFTRGTSTVQNNTSADIACRSYSRIHVIEVAQITSSTKTLSPSLCVVFTIPNGLSIWSF